MCERVPYPSFSSISCIEVLSDTHLLRVYSGASFEQMFWRPALPSAVALYLPSLGSFSPLSLIRWAAGWDVNDYRLQLCLLQGGLVGNPRRTKLLNLPIAIGNIAWRKQETRHLLLLYYVQPWWEICVSYRVLLLCTHLGSHRVLLRARVHALTSRNVDHSQVCGSPKKSYLQNSVGEDEGKDQKEPTLCHLVTSRALLSDVSYGNVPFTERRVVLPALCVQSVLDLNTASLLTHGFFFPPASAFILP